MGMCGAAHQGQAIRFGGVRLEQAVIDRRTFFLVFGGAAPARSDGERRFTRQHELEPHDAAGALRLSCTRALWLCPCHRASLSTTRTHRCRNSFYPSTSVARGLDSCVVPHPKIPNSYSRPAPAASLQWMTKTPADRMNRRGMPSTQAKGKLRNNLFVLAPTSPSVRSRRCQRHSARPALRFRFWAARMTAINDWCEF